MRHSCAWLLCAALLACGVPPASPPRNVIWAEFDPSTGKVPSPTDLVRDAANKKLNLPITPDLSPAEAEFRAYLNTLDGFPTSTPALFHFTAKVKPDSLTKDSVVVFKLDATGKINTAQDVTRTWSETELGYTLYPTGGWALGASYLVAVRGGASGVAGAGGEKVLAAPAFYFLRAGQDLTQHPWALPGKTPADRMAAATQLEAVRQVYEPLFQQITSKVGWTREEIALAFTFTTTTHPALHFDPLSSAIPLPNDLVLDPGTGLVSLPADPNDTPAQAKVKAALNTLDGFSTSGVFAADTTKPIDVAHASGASNIRLFELTDPPTEVTGLDRWLYQDNQHVFAQVQSKGKDASGNYVPPVVLKPKTTYAWVITGQKGTDGSPVDAQPVGALLRLKASLLKDGKSQVSGIADADAKLLEPQRARMEKLLDYLEGHGLPRAQLEAAVPFTTVDVRGHLEALVKIPDQQHLSVEPTDHVDETPLDVSLAAAAAMPNVSTIVNGHFLTFDRLDPVKQAFSGPGTARPIAFTVTLPSGVSNPKVILFGHGLTTERRLSWFEADRLARAGFAVFSFDLPYHGERSSCNGHLPICTVMQGAGLSIPNCNDNNPALICRSGICDADGQCAGGVDDFNTYPVYNYGALFDPNNPGTPYASGSAFIDLEDLGASRDHFRQAIIDLSAAYRFIMKADWTRILPGGQSLDTSDVRYTGISLGGILGAVESGDTPPIRVLALNVGGAGLVDLFQESTTFGAILLPGLKGAGVVSQDANQLTDDLGGIQFLTVAHWLLDDIDPLNIARFTLQSTGPFPDPATGQSVNWPQKHVLVQMAGADTIVSNGSTERLRFVLDPECCDNQAQSCDPSAQCEFHAFPLASHIFEVDPAELINEVAGQNEVADFLVNH